MHDVCDVERRDFRGGAHQWRRLTSLADPHVFSRKDWGAAGGEFDCEGKSFGRKAEDGLKARRASKTRARLGGRHVVEHLTNPGLFLLCSSSLYTVIRVGDIV